MKKKIIIIITALLVAFAAIFFITRDTRTLGEKSFTQGYTYYNEEKDDGITLISKISNDAKTEDGYFTLLDTYTIDDHDIVLYYMITDQQVNYGEGDTEIDDDITYQYYLQNYDLESQKRGNCLDLGNQCNYEIQLNNDLLWIFKDEQDHMNAIAYNGDFDKIREMTLSNDTYGVFGSDGFYYTYNETAKQITKNGYTDLEDNSKSVENSFIEVQNDFMLSSCNFPFSYKDTLYFVCGGIAGNLKEYDNVIINGETGKLAFLDHDFNGTFSNYNNTLIYETFKGKKHNWTLVNDSLKTYQEDEDNVSTMQLVDDYILFSKFESKNDQGILYLDLYKNDGSHISSASVSCEEDYFYIITQPVLFNDQLYITADALDGTKYNFSWNFSKGNSSTYITVKDTNIPETLVSYEKKFNPSDYKAEAIDSSLQPLKDKTNQLSEDYGLNIYISTECRMILGGYAVEDLSDYDCVEAAVDTLSDELKKYPEGFYHQLITDYVSGIDVYIAGTIMGVDDSSLEYAGGFTIVDDEHEKIVIDATDDSSIINTLHHETSHAIETKLNNDGYYLDTTDWEKLNPDTNDKVYTYTYSQFGKGKMLNYIYGECKDQDVYFIDDYSLTYPGEDRARLFEYVMASEDYYFENSPHLQKKMNYYANTIRKDFDTSSWKDVPWEKYLN